jgi:hypothetical protein
MIALYICGGSGCSGISRAFLRCGRLMVTTAMYSPPRSIRMF